MLLINQLVSAILQVFILSLIPFVWYTISNKKVAGFLMKRLMHNKAEDSILYGWSIHALYNIISPIVVFAFLL